MSNDNAGRFTLDDPPETVPDPLSEERSIEGNNRTTSDLDVDDDGVESESTIQEVASVPVDKVATLKDKTTTTNITTTNGATRTTASLPRHLGWKQVSALYFKNLLVKYRTPFPTFMEIFSPVLMMLILVAAYSLSEITDRSAKTYSTVELDVPGPWFDLVTRATEIAGGGTTNLFPTSSEQLRRRRRRRLVTDNDGSFETSPILYDLLGLDFDDSYFHNDNDNDELEDIKMDGIDTPESFWQDTARRELQAFDDGIVDDDAVNGTDADDGNDEDVFSLLDDARRQVSRTTNESIHPSFVSSFVRETHETDAFKVNRFHSREALSFRLGAFPTAKLTYLCSSPDRYHLSLSTF